MLSGVILTRNEGSKIRKTIKSLSFCDEVVVVDDYSDDSTDKIAVASGAIVFRRHLNNDFASQRNFAMKKCKHDWLLFVDADEFVPIGLAKEIKHTLENSTHQGYFLVRKEIFMGKLMQGGEWGAGYILRLGKKDAGRWKLKIHEQWEIKGSKGFLYSPLLHYPSNSIDLLISKINKYTNIHALENERLGKNADVIKLFIWPILKFFVTYFCKRGYRDGVHGFVYGVLMSFHSYLAWSKQWENQRRVQ